MNTRALCKKFPDGSREHKMSKKEDFARRVFDSCDKCGACFMGTIDEVTIVLD